MKKLAIFFFYGLILVFLSGCNESNKIETLNKSDLQIQEIRKALEKIVPKEYTSDPRYKVWEVRKIEPLPASGPYYGMGIKQGGKELADRSWFVQLRFTKLRPSPSLSQGILFLVKEKGKWKAWYRYR